MRIFGTEDAANFISEVMAKLSKDVPVPKLSPEVEGSAEMLAKMIEEMERHIEESDYPEFIAAQDKKHAVDNLEAVKAQFSEISEITIKTHPAAVADMMRDVKEALLANRRESFKLADTKLPFAVRLEPTKEGRVQYVMLRPLTAEPNANSFWPEVVWKEGQDPGAMFMREIPASIPFPTKNFFEGVELVITKCNEG